MDYGFFEILIVSFVSGISEFVPVSSQAHQQILLKLFGIRQFHPMLQFFIHIGILIGLILASKNYIRKISRELALKRIPRRRRKRQPDPQTVMDASLVKHASIVMLLGFLFIPIIHSWENLLVISASLLLLNGLILHIPMYLSSANKDSRSMTKLDSFAMGAISALGVLPGISRIGVCASYCAARGGDYQSVYRWALLISIPALVGHCITDLILLFSTGFQGVDGIFLLLCILGTIMAGAGSLLAINLIRMFTAKNGFSSFSYYCWGAALFTFIIYMYT